jgi:predicted neutral ceramidase superfamily lipid hydrolase
MIPTKQFFTNPFVKVGGFKALTYGLLALAGTSFTAWFWQTRFDGVLDIHFGRQFAYHIYLLDLVVSYLSITAILFLAGLFFSKSRIRLVDVAGTTALARAPLILAPLANTFSHSQLISDYMIGMMSGEEASQPGFMQSFLFALSVLIVLTITIYVIVLTYKAFSVSTNLKGNKAIIIFIISMLIAEVISKIMIHNFVHPII